MTSLGLSNSTGLRIVLLAKTRDFHGRAMLANWKLEGHREEMSKIAYLGTTSFWAGKGALPVRHW